ncbi:MAG: signal peptidase II [Candidatus Dadabacteria bacterium]|nr:MAG: signal peptidase II [Candidatus Dadabacteria bacterium]
MFNKQPKTASTTEQKSKRIPVKFSNRKRVNSLKIVACVTLLVTALDQYTKHIILEHLAPGETITVIPSLFNIILTFNKGAAFGIFSNMPDGHRTIILGMATISALAVVAYLLVKDYKGNLWGQIALSMVLGGAFGNIIDRIRLGMVVDFLDFYIGAYHWPAFNLADSAITAGICILILIRTTVSRENHK